MFFFDKYLFFIIPVNVSLCALDFHLCFFSHIQLDKIWIDEFPLVVHKGSSCISKCGFFFWGGGYMSERVQSREDQPKASVINHYLMSLCDKQGFSGSPWRHWTNSPWHRFGRCRPEQVFKFKCCCWICSFFSYFLTQLCGLISAWKTKWSVFWCFGSEFFYVCWTLH